MDNRVAGCQPPAGATPLLRFGLPSPPGVVGMVMAGPLCDMASFVGCVKGAWTVPCSSLRTVRWVVAVCSALGRCVVLQLYVR